jgi:putative ABC transport system ATP-binding protein
MIELEHVCRVFEVGDAKVHALRDVNLSVSRGEYVSLMGPSGSGKSTLLNAIGLLDRPTSGVYRLDGREVSALDEVEQAKVRRERIGFVFQFFHLVRRLSASENIELPLVLAGVDPQERRARVQAALESVGLSDRAKHRPDQLSGGQRQKVAIARALIMEPEVILADEPTGNLDRAAGLEVIELLERFRARGIALIVVSHDPAIGQRAARRIRLEDGAIAADDRGDGR